MTSAGGPEPGQYNLMVSAAGRRVALMHILERSLRFLDLRGSVVATDINPMNAAFHAAGEASVVPRYKDPGCLEALLDICRERRVGLIVPTIDPDLRFYARHREAFEGIGTRIALSSQQTVRLSEDKQLTHQWLSEHSFPTIAQAPAEEVQKGLGDWRFPIFVKPRRGSSSAGARVIRGARELAALTDPGQYLAQEYIRGQEYTVDVYVDREGRCRCAVPRARLEVRGGEVSKAMTVRMPRLQALARRIAEALPGARGVLNIQVFHDPRADRFAVVEINARFGGGYPLTEQAGAPMARWLIEDMAGLPLSAAEDQWEDGLVMLRYDDAVFVTRKQLRAKGEVDLSLIEAED